MNIIRPPFTGNAEIDSWTNQITQALNMGLLLPGVQGQSSEGAAGPSGNTAIYLYQRTTDNTAPSRPTSVVYDYTDIENVTITANNGWVGEVPTSSGKYLWITFRYVSNLQDTVTNANTWNTVVLLSEDGDDGETGLTGASTNIIFIRSSSAPSTPAASSGVPATWYDSPPEGTELLWASSGLKSISSTTFTWSTPFQIEGEAIVEVSIYRKNSAVFSTGGSYNFVTQTLTPPTDWLTEPPSLTSNNDVIYRISGVASGSSTQTAATVSYGSPVTYAQRTDGSNGYNSARVLLHKKYTSATLPGAQLFSGTFTYTFSTGALSGGTLNGWSQTAPSLSAGEFLFTSEALAYAAETTVDIPTSSFTTPQITGIAGTNGTNGTDAVDGVDGTDGLNNATVFLYNKSSSATAPSLFSGTFTYTFSTGVLSGGTLNSWSQEPPALSQGDNLWVSLATASSRTATDSVPTTEFSTPEITSIAGTDGTNGANTARVSLFRKTSTNSAPADPSGTFTYTFSTGVLSGGTLNSWSQSAPSLSTGEYLWVIQASAFSSSATDTIAASEFTTAAITGIGGTNGNSAKLLVLNATDQVFTYDADNVADPTSQTITFTAFLDNTVDTTATWSSSPSVTLTGTGNTRSLSVANFGSNTSVTITASADSAAVSDTFTVYRLKDGATGADGTAGEDALTLILSNEAHTFAADKNGVVASYSGSGTTIKLFEGTSEILYDGAGTSDGSFNVSVSASGITAGTVTDSGSFATVGNQSNMTADAADITYTITGKRADGSVINLTKTQSFSKSKVGANGLTGASTNIVFIRSSSQPTTPANSSGIPTSWFDSPPAGTEILWAASGIKTVGATTFTWSTPFQIEGASVTEVSIYRKNSNTFSTGGSYNFVTQTLTPPTDWLVTAPSLSSNNDVIYRISGVASGSATQTAATVNYGSPVVYAQRTDGTNGTDGTPADVLRNVYLYDSSVSAPSTPTSTQGFNSTTGNAADTGTWTTTVPSIGTGHALWITTSILTQTEGTGSFTSGGWTVYQASGYDGGPGPTGPAAPRFVSRRVYASSSTGTPGAPSATLTWSTLALSGITAGTPSATWSETAPTAVATSTTLVYFSDLLFIDVTGIATTSSDTGSTPKEGISFSGLVTFNSGDFALNGAPITSIDGGNITTGTITTDKLNIDEYLSLSGAESAFLAGRTSDSDFTDNGFFIGRTSTNGTSADGFQLSMTSLVDSSTTGPAGALQDSTLQAIIHSNVEGLKIFEPITYNRVAMDPTDTNIVTTLDAANETVTLTKGFIWEVEVVGAGSGGSAGGYYYGSFTYGTAGSAGGSTTATLTGASGYSGTRTWTATGGAAPAQISGGGYVSGNGARLLGGVSGEAGPFGAGGNGGIGALTRVGDDEAPLTSSMTAPTSPTVPPSYGSGGGGGSQKGDKSSVQYGPTLPTPGGLAGQSITVILDLRDATTDGVLTATSVGAAGAGGTISVSGVPQINGAAGGQGAICAAEFFNLYEGHDVRDIIDTVTSERDKKENLQEITDPIDKVKALTGYTYNYRTGDKKKDIGLLVEDLELIFPELIISTQISKRVRYGPLVALLIEALKVQDTEIQSLNTIVQDLINRVEVLENNP